MNLFAFIKSFTKDEIKVISKAFPQKKSENNAQVSLESQFFYAVLKHSPEELSDEFIIEKLPGFESKSVFLKLKSRVFFKILERISSEKFVRNKNTIGDVDRGEVRVQKKLLQVKILALKTASASNEVVFHLLNEIITEAKEYELYEMLVEALTYKMFRLGIRSGYDEYKKIEEEIHLYRECANMKSEANKFYYEIIVNQSLISHFSPDGMREHIEKRIKILEASPYTTVSGRIHYFYKYLKLALAESEKKYSDCVDICLEILSLLERTKAIEREDRRGKVYGNLSHFLILKRQYKNAMQTARQAQHYFAHQSLNYILTLEQEFIAGFYALDYVRCHELLNLMLAHEKQDSGKIRFDKFTFYQGCLFFSEGNFKEAKRIAGSSLSLLKDKNGWDLGVRYLKIMSFVELKDYEAARYSIEALRKQRERAGSGGTGYSKRSEFIFRALTEYSLGGFKQQSNRLSYLLKELGKRDTPLSWSFFTPELIPVHKWIAGRIKKRPVSKTKKALLS